VPLLACVCCRQVYLGGYDGEEAAAEAYDMAALKSKGPGCPTNFPPGEPLAKDFADLPQLAWYASIT
jgi:hypothetical protein